VTAIGWTRGTNGLLIGTDARGSKTVVRVVLVHGCAKNTMAGANGARAHDRRGKRRLGEHGYPNKGGRGAVVVAATRRRSAPSGSEADGRCEHDGMAQCQGGAHTAGGGQR
jgi:hypothetical protein